MSFTKPEPYDSTSDTKEHINRVAELLKAARNNLKNRGNIHDVSKLEEPEKSVFDRETPLLRDLVYGSDEYKEALERLGEALKHHYSKNTHHPEHFGDGINGMSLFDVVEMLMDWKAASERHATGDIRKSLEINRERFLISDQLYDILLNTVKEMEW